jgi:nicotinamidase-related amidase
MQNNSFLDWLTRWQADLPSLNLGTVVSDPARVALVSEDLLKGFCDQGALSSPRAASILPTVAHLFQRAHDLGVGHFLLFQDTHDADAVEFSAFPPHCVRGTAESETVDALNDLAFSEQFVVFSKNSISSNVGVGFDNWLDARTEIDTFIVVGVCTDICVFHAAMHLRTRANVLGQRDARVIVPVDCVQTYDLPVKTALELGALPHDGDLLHRLFLYQMALNGVEVVSSLI